MNLTNEEKVGYFLSKLSGISKDEITMDFKIREDSNKTDYEVNPVLSIFLNNKLQIKTSDEEIAELVTAQDILDRLNDH